MERRDCPAGSLLAQDTLGYYQSITLVAFEYTCPGCQTPTASMRGYSLKAAATPHRGWWLEELKNGETIFELLFHTQDD